MIQCVRSILEVLELNCFSKRSMWKWDFFNHEGEQKMKPSHSFKVTSRDDTYRLQDGALRQIPKSHFPVSPFFRSHLLLSKHRLIPVWPLRMGVRIAWVHQNHNLQCNDIQCLNKKKMQRPRYSLSYYVNNPARTFFS